jgi:hypothetical protein
MHDRFWELLEMVGGIVILVFVLYVLFSLPTMWLWNALMPDIFGLPEIGIWQALGIQILTSLLFGSWVKPNKE